jgi:ATP-binding cassette subfamily F protein 3
MRQHPMMVSEARDHLARYLFRGDEVYKLVRELSGGERGRLALSILALNGANFLLLDEPTNHLDINSQEIMQEVLENFAGTILLVSHDRYIIDHLATQIWHVYDGKLHVFNGNYRTYLAHRAEMAEAKKETVEVVKPVKPSPNGTPQLSKNEQRKRDEALAEIEVRVHLAEERVGALTVALQNATVAQRFDKIQSISIEYAEAESELETVMNEWEDFLNE